MKKRGVSHIEIIMAFILFISAVAFVFIFINPFATKNPTSAIEKYSLNELTNLLKTNITTYTLIISDNVNDNAIAIDLGFTIPSAVNARAKYYSGIELPSGISSDRNKVYLTWNKDNGHVVLISLSEEFEAYTPDPDIASLLPENKYQISSSVFFESISESKTSALEAEYFAQYSILKAELNIPPQADFGFKLSLPGKTIAANKIIPENIEVKSRNKIVRVVNPSGSQLLGNLEVSIW
ncbi:MAG: hypothetical protein AABX07_03680 [Nanoarchaeota archaeon]